MLQIQIRNVEPDIVVLDVTGALTMGRDCKQLEWSTEELVRENRKKIIFDLSGVTRIDSTGVGIVVTAAGQIKQAGGQVRVCAQGHVENVLKLTSVDKVVGLHPSIAGATAGF
jgi:anti-sigma B factor antagonist